MCGRYTLKENKEQVAGWLDAVMEGFEDYEPDYNVAPSKEMPVMVTKEKTRERLLYPFRWGLLPFWAKEEKTSYSMINARAESLATKKSFKPSFESQRCIVPASGFYEWKGEKGDKTPYYIYPTHESLFAFAGLYNVWRSPDGKTRIPTYTIITTDANRTMEELHDRMPAMLLREEWDEWLDRDNHDTGALQELLRPFPDDALAYYPVSKAVNNVRNNGPELIERAEE